MNRTERAELLGLAFDAVTMETAVARCLEFCRGPRTSHTVITANAFHLCMMRHDPELALACRIMGVGGSFDVLAGFISRAPHWAQAMGLEWFWRLLIEPRKLWRRYPTNIEFICLAGQEIIAHRLRRRSATQGHT